MSTNQPDEQHPGLTGAEYVGYRLFWGALGLIGTLLKLVLMLIFPSLIFHRNRGGVWRRFTAGMWPIIYAAYPIIAVAAVASQRPNLAGMIGVTWIKAYAAAAGFFGVVAILTLGHRLAFFRVPGGGIIRAVSSSGLRSTDGERSVFPLDTLYKKYSEVRDTPNMKANWHAAFGGASGMGKSTHMMDYVSKIDTESRDPAIVCHDEDGEFRQFLQSIGYETLVFRPREDDVIPEIMSCVKHPDDIDIVADALVSGTNKDNNKFAPGAKTVISGGLRLLWGRLGQEVTNKMVYDFFSRQPDDIHDELVDAGMGHYAGPLKDSESGQSPHMTVVNSAMNKGLRGSLKKEGNVNLSNFVNNPDDYALVLDSGQDDMDSAGPAFRLIIDLVMREGMRSSDTCAFLLADEVDTLPGSSVVGEVAARGRSKDCFVVVGFQTVSQMVDNFGEGPANQILSNLGNYFMFNPRADEKTWDMIKRLLGEERRREYSNSQSRSSRHMLERDTRTAGSSDSIRERCPLSDEEISRMGRGDCIIVEFDGGWWFGNLSLPEWI